MTSTPVTGPTGPTGPPDGPCPVAPRAGRAAAVGGAVTAAASLTVLLVLAPDGLARSADPGSPLVPSWHLLLPTAVALALVGVLPPRADLPAPRVADRRRVLAAVAVMLGAAAVFPLVVASTGVGARAEYHLVKVAVLVLVPGVAVLATRGSLTADRPRVAWRWWAPAVVVLVWTLLAQAAPWLQHGDYSAYPADLLLAAGVATALTAGVGEELLYRVWLQTRLEALLGRWGGIAVATLAFAALHVGSRHGQGLLVEVAGAVVLQGLGFGLVAAFLWSRYRNAWLTVALHVLANGYVVAAELLG
ncbi:Abortive infection protein [Cellulomonas flavigena DSM 20109]|uniref:Abortive infection protein n=1 Tax=Cellulomonas flavigena (strain ATCC 482 / DSM 20109 / BCRC 11376 / JCM 18109 / NBRC 3775 / NCIMB 8073 / NRS 134) TaxID=446466 RepID=D5UBV7_CELFN|nr:CPBP family intramembrane glutamic endopeptidase [Cellulomonas flavigena]ADG76116.1 Abortive infection protein [Cellulomonas flavigena DSM 20109]